MTTSEDEHHHRELAERKSFRRFLRLGTEASPESHQHVTTSAGARLQVRSGASVSSGANFALSKALLTWSATLSPPPKNDEQRRRGLAMPRPCTRP